MASTNQNQPPRAVNASAKAAASNKEDKPVRVLVKTKTHLVPGDKSTATWDRIHLMENLICQHAWQRKFDRYRERGWAYRCEFGVHNRKCWFMVDHHSSDAKPDPDAASLLWYRWTATKFIQIRKPLPPKVRHHLRHYPFERFPWDDVLRRLPLQPLEKFDSVYEEIFHKQEILRRTLTRNLALTEDHAKFVREHPEYAEWARARIPPEAWARLDDPLQIQTGRSMVVTCGKNGEKDSETLWGLAGE